MTACWLLTEWVPLNAKLSRSALRRKRGAWRWSQALSPQSRASSLQLHGIKGPQLTAWALSQNVSALPSLTSSASILTSKFFGKEIMPSLTSGSCKHRKYLNLFTNLQQVEGIDWKEVIAIDGKRFTGESVGWNVRSKVDCFQVSCCACSCSHCSWVLQQAASWRCWQPCCSQHMQPGSW